MVERSLGVAREDRSLAESLPPSTRPVLAATGFLPAVDAAGFQANTGNTALWHGQRRSDGFADGAVGFHVLRSRFDGLLREAVSAAGARVVEGVVRKAALGGEGWRVAVDVRPGATGGAGRIALEAPWALDCTGRAGVLARRGRVAETEAPTLAIVRRYSSADGWDGVDAGHALVESFGVGWAWSVPASRRRRHVAVMLDPELIAVAGRSGDGLDEAFDRRVAETSLIRSVVEQARPDGGAWAVAASMYASSSFASERALFVGDAGSFADPMSSFGVKKALASGWLAAVAVNTALESPALESVAVDFYREREREMYASLRKALAVEVDAVGDGSERGFWRRRAAWLASEDGESLEGWTRDADVLRDEEVQSAFRALRAGTGRLRPGTLRETRAPVVDGNRIRMARALLAPRFPKGVRYLRGVDVLQLARMAAPGIDPGQLYERYVGWADPRGAPRVEMADVLAVVSILVADGALRLEDGPAG